MRSAAILPGRRSRSIIEPLRLLFKDEVRKAGLELGIPEYLVYRQPFPGPGLGVRIIGEIDLGKNKSYIQGISSGRSMPSMKQFFEICDYLEITPLEFFDTEMAEPPQFRRAVELLKELNQEDWEAIIPLLMRLRKEITQKQAEP